MSTYWGYGCKECGTNSEPWANHGEELLEQYARIHKMLSETSHFSLLDIKVGWFTDEANEFLDEHEGHTIVLINEYGETKSINTDMIIVYNKKEIL